MKYFSKASVIALFGYAFVLQSNTNQNSELQLLKQAKVLRYSQKWYEAASIYRTLIEKFPESTRRPEFKFWLAATLEQDQRWEEAIDTYTDFIFAFPEQRILKREAKLNRIRCWGIRQFDSLNARNGLKNSLEDEIADVQFASALQLAKAGNTDGVEVLRRELKNPTNAHSALIALNSLGIELGKSTQTKADRKIVLTINDNQYDNPVIIKIPVQQASIIGSYLSKTQQKILSDRNIQLNTLLMNAHKLPKGSQIISLKDSDSVINIAIE